MRHVLAADDDGPVLLLTVHAVAVWGLTGLSFTVHRVVYPSFLLVGPTTAWPAVHAQHVRRVAQVVAVPWAVQGATTAVLLVARPDHVPGWLALLTGAFAGVTVAVTVLGAIPAHDRLSGFDAQTVRRLLRASWWRTAAWCGGSACAAAMLLVAARGSASGS